ncbi:putative protein N(5)-glutamine methyltransferase [Subtercola sp. PAMC28395]|uniref:putative protein N(5)-glutamine methyltransferase n=1 Tax=Subtercola sp. PAMC28395 TaxID=2846775 RepID=UPI001C0D6143|nr:putative protein N(5)-glutamine methyltransferase [Subtercola sp. PAMC28395]QWT25214.1 putative protein N(5)-glutamine methyltransferase [Subtercola sp. PAMC28395]
MQTEQEFAQVVARLREAGCVFAEEEAALVAEAAESQGGLRELVDRRVGGEPLEYILGWAEFCGHRVGVQPGVFVPRRRSEYLVELALEESRASEPLVILDLCCGSGALGLAVALERPDAVLVSVDVDPAAVACARRNLAGIGEVFEGDLFDAVPESVRGRVTTLLVNAPYVPTESIALMPPEARLYEAPVALDGGGDGLDVQRRVAAGAADWLVGGGSLLIETSTLQAERTAALFAAVGLEIRIEHSGEYGATVVIATMGRSSIAPGGGHLPE